MSFAGKRHLDLDRRVCGAGRFSLLCRLTFRQDVAGQHAVCALLLPLAALFIQEDPTLIHDACER